MCEIYGMYLHGEELSAMAANDLQKQLIKLFESYSDTKRLIKDIRRLDSVKNRHDAGLEFCGCIHKRIESHKIDVVIDAIKSGKSCKEAASKVGMSAMWATNMLRNHSYRFCNNRWTTA